MTTKATRQAAWPAKRNRRPPERRVQAQPVWWPAWWQAVQAQKRELAQRPKRETGFRRWTPQERHAIACLGAAVLHAQGKAHQWTATTARTAALRRWRGTRDKHKP